MARKEPAPSHPTDDQPGLTAEQTEHCFACYRPVRPGKTYYLTIQQEVLCADCALHEGAVRVREDLAVEVKRDRLPVRRGKAEVFPGEIRHPVDAVAEAAGRLVDQKAQEGGIATFMFLWYTLGTAPYNITAFIAAS